MAGVKTDLFKLVCHIADQPSAKITANNLKEQLGHRPYEQLIANKAFVPAPHGQDIAVMVDDEERSYAIHSRSDGLAYFSPHAGWTPVKGDDLLVYQVNFDWLLRVIMDGLKIPANMQPQTILENKVWFLGSAWLGKRKTPVIFARTITKQDSAESLRGYLQDRHATDPALILASAASIPAYFRLPGHNRVVLVSDAIDMENKNFAFQMRYLAGKMGCAIDQAGFSQGYRNAFINGVSYNFSLLQAEILEVLDTEKRPMHKTEIISRLTSQRSDPKSAFRSKGKPHPAWNVMIMNDKRGNYWLKI
jgi:hypothetical protein